MNNKKFFSLIVAIIIFISSIFIGVNSKVKEDTRPYFEKQQAYINLYKQLSEYDLEVHKKYLDEIYYFEYN